MSFGSYRAVELPPFRSRVPSLGGGGVTRVNQGKAAGAAEQRGGAVWVNT